MIRHKALFGAAWSAVGIGCPPLAADAADPAAPAVPAVGEVVPAHRAYLSRVARRTLRDALASGAMYEPTYVPEALAGLEMECLVRVRFQGYLLTEGAGGPAPAARAVRDAALSAGSWLQQHQPVEPGESDAWLMEIEAAGPMTALPGGLDWTQPGALDHHLEPGVDGLAVAAGDHLRRICPSEMFTSDATVDDALRHLAEGLRLGPEQTARTPLFRFRTQHWYEPEAGADVVSLRRGMTVVAAEAVTSRSVKDAIGRLSEYVLYRQRGSGLFSYEFDAGADRYSHEDNLVRQAWATAATAMYARWSGTASSLAAADVAIRRHLDAATQFPGDPRASFIATADGQHKLGVTALVCVALARHPTPEKYAQSRARLIRGILALQRPSGMFLTAFPPAVGVGGQDYFPGEALLALATEYDLQPAGPILEAFDRAMGFYQDYFRASRAPAFVPWQVQAFAIMARHTRRTDYADYVFELTDWLASKQLTAANCVWPELHGGIAAGGGTEVSAATAAYLEAFADSLELARRQRDDRRVRAYTSAVRAATRFVMQLQVRGEEAYFVRSPRDAVGGVRMGPALNRIRIDHCQHALIALLKAHDALFSETP